MLEWLPFVLAVVVLIAAAIGLLIFFRRKRPEPPPLSPDGTEMIEATVEDGVASPSDIPQARRRLPERWQSLSVLQRALALGLSILVLGLFVTASYLAILGNQRSDVRVAVASFTDSGDGGTGRQVADDLAELLRRQSAGRYHVERVELAPSEPQEALAEADRVNADILIYGSVAAGAMLDSPSLSPRLIYTPRGPYGPNAWDGYRGRFLMPRSYTISAQAINGQVVMPALIGALADYSNGYPDLAYATLTTLLENYSLLDPLPRALLGNILWARGTYAAAADQYRRALAVPSDEQAFLANNLGAILNDAGDIAALTEFDRAVRLLDNRDLGELRFNLGVLALREADYVRAAESFEQARNLLPANGHLLFALAEVYRESGRLSDATVVFDEARAQLAADAQLVPHVYRTMHDARGRAALASHGALIELARQVQARDRLIWELEVSPPLPDDVVQRLARQLLEAAVADEEAVTAWRRRSATDEAASAGSGLLANGQAEQHERYVRQAEFWQAVLQIEQHKARLAAGATSNIGDAFGVLWQGGLPIDQGIDTLERLIATTPNSAVFFTQYGRALRYKGDLAQSNAQFDQVIALASQQPEGYYGKGMAALAQGASDAATPLLQQALQFNERFFPARYQLATVAVQQSNWPLAAQHYAVLAEQRPGTQSALDLARVLSNIGPEGVAQAETILAPLSQHDARAATELGRLYARAGEIQAAIDTYRTALQLDSTIAEASYELGKLLAAQGDARAAAQHLNDALRSDPDNVAARLELARLYQGPLDNRAAANAEYQRILGRRIGDPLVLLEIGDTLRTNENAALAADAYNQALGIDPNNALIHMQLAATYLDMERFSSAQSEAQRVLELTSSASDPAVLELRARALVLQGDVARLQGDLDGALSLYSQALGLDVDNVRATIGQGQAAVGQGNWDAALNYFERAIVLPGGAEDAEARFWLAEAQLRTQQFATAVDNYNRALTLQPIFPEALLGLAHAQRTLGDLNAANATIDQALVQRPNYAEALLFRGNNQREQGQITAAQDSYSRAVSANPDLAEVRFRRGTLYVEQQNYDRAVADLRAATRLQPNFPDAHYWLGRAYYAQGQFASAAQAFNAAIAQLPNFAEAYYYLGLSEEDQGNREAALAAYRNVVAIDGNSTWGVQASARIDRLS
jgi:tetratricopeptide (TPR) repeat protein